MLATKSIATMVDNGVRRNDLGIIKRNNRYYDETGTVTYKRESEEAAEQVSAEDDQVLADDSVSSHSE